MRLHQYLAMTEEVSGSSAALGRLMTEQQFLEAHSGLGLQMQTKEAPPAGTPYAATSKHSGNQMSGAVTGAAGRLPGAIVTQTR